MTSVAVAATASSSQETLVSDDQFQFILTSDNPSNTNIRGPNGTILYRVQTTFDNGTVTTVTRGSSNEIVAALHWSSIGMEKIALGSGKPVRMGSLLHSFPFSISQTVSFKDPEGRKYEWKGNSAGRALCLYAMDTPGSPIAAFSKSRPDPNTGSRTKAYLRIEPRGQEIMDIVVWSFLFLEKNRRLLENSYGMSTKYGGA